MKYYFVLAEHESRFCKPIKAGIFISESPEEFYIRNLRARNNIWSGTFYLSLWRETIREVYLRGREFNPTNEGYFKLRNRDYSIIEKEE